MYSYEAFKEYQEKKKISDRIEYVEAQANTHLSIKTYQYFGRMGPVKKNQTNAYLKHHGFISREEYTKYVETSILP